MEDARTVFLSVARCSNVALCLENNESHPCGKIVRHQMQARGVTKYEDFQVPEPWVGELSSARILFVSSNPSIGEDRHGLGSMTDEMLWNSHHLAFGGGDRSYVLDGIYSTDSDGLRLKKVAYWVAVRARARELLPNAVPGKDYALTEMVHCKSEHELGVVEALDECKARHFDHILAISPAAVLIVLGKPAREYFLGSASVAPTSIECRNIAGRERLIAYLPHPASFTAGPRTLAGLFPNDLDRLRSAVAKP
jgi:uracil-DNA glycosylase